MKQRKQRKQRIDFFYEFVLFSKKNKFCKKKNTNNAILTMRCF